MDHNEVGIIVQGLFYGLWLQPAVLCVVKQGSSPQTAAENQTTFISFCVYGLTNKPIMHLEIDCHVSFCG